MKKVYILIFVIIVIIIGGIFLLRNKSNEEKMQNINYEIITDRNIIRQLKISDNDDRGYEIVEYDNFYYLIIRYGLESVYYNKLVVVKVEVNGKNLKIQVELPENEGVGEAFSHPKAIIKLDQKPEKIQIEY